MIRKAALQIAAIALLAFMAVNTYLAIRHLQRIRQSAELTQESSTIQAHIADVSRDLTDMETGQRGYLLSGDTEYLQPYTEAKGRIGADFASLRSAFANRDDRERALESELESVTASKQDEMERTITLREKGYRHRAFQLLNTNEGRDYMERARALVATLSSIEHDRFGKFESERDANVQKAFRETAVVNGSLLVLTACLFLLIRAYGRVLEHEAARSKQALAARDLQLEKITSALSGEIHSKIIVIEENARELLEKYGPFLPRQGNEYAEEIKETAAQLEQLRGDLLGSPSSAVDRRAA